MTPIRRLLVAVPFALLAAGCGPSVRYTDSDVPKLTVLKDIMWAQAQAMDPQFSRMFQSTYTDDEFADIGAAATRLQLTAPRIKEFSKGPDFDKLADELNNNAVQLGAAAGAKNAADTSRELREIKDTCRSCHNRFR
jgi:hypothetical protein